MTMGAIRNRLKATIKIRKQQNPIAAGLAVVAADTGRVLMIQRPFRGDDSNRGKWEFPGGRIEDGESSLDAAIREWKEETGLELPGYSRSDAFREWMSSDGKYAGYVVHSLQGEADIDLNSRDLLSDPDSETNGVIAWVHPHDLSQHNLRSELLSNVDEVLARITKWLLRHVAKYRSQLPTNRLGQLVLHKAEGTCKPGQRSDLTGCTPASQEGTAGNPVSESSKESSVAHQESPKQPKVRVVGEGEYSGKLLHGTTQRSAEAFLRGEDLPEGDRSRTMSEWGSNVIYASDHSAPHQALMFASNRSSGPKGKRVLLEFQLKPGSKVLDMASEMVRRPAMNPGGEEYVKFRGRPSITDDLMSWMNEKREDRGLQPLPDDKLRSALDPTAEGFGAGDYQDYLGYLASYARDRGYAAVRTTDETVIVDRSAIASSRKLKTQEVEALRQQPRLHKPHGPSPLYTDEPEEPKHYVAPVVDKGAALVNCLKDWVTIGGTPAAHGGRDEEHHGGARVFIDESGNISRGPAGLTGRNISEIDQGKRKPGEKPKPPEPKNRLTSSAQSKPAEPDRQDEAPESTGPTKPPEPATDFTEQEPPYGSGQRPAQQQSDSGGGTPEPGGTSQPLAPETEGTGDRPTDQGRQNAAQPTREGTAGDVPGSKRIPVSLEHVNKRIDRYENLFRAKGQEKQAAWMGLLREHVNKVGTEEALKELGEERPTSRRERVTYEGEKAGWESMEDFTRSYLNRHGIVPIHEVGGNVKADVSSLAATTFAPDGPEDGYTTGDLYTGRGATLHETRASSLNKLQEAKNLPGLESSEDLGVLLGRPVTHLDDDVITKLDETYGKGKWIVKVYGDDAYAGFGIFFPQRVAQLKRQAQDAIWSSGQELAKYGFSHLRDKSGAVVGVKHKDSGEYLFNSSRYGELYGDVRTAADRALAAAKNERGPALLDRDGNVSGKQFMAQPAFEAVGISDEERARGVTGAEGGKGEGRVHVLTRNGKAEIVPHSTWVKGEWLPVVFENEQTRAMAQAAVDAINALPESERQGQIYAPDVMPTAKGYRVVEANPSNEVGGSGYLGDNPFIVDSYVSHVLGQEPAHTAFIRDLLSKRRNAKSILGPLAILKRSPLYVTQRGVIAKAAGTCKPGQRADLTGCTPSTGEGGGDSGNLQEAEGLLERWVGGDGRVFANVNAELLASGNLPETVKALYAQTQQALADLGIAKRDLTRGIVLRNETLADMLASGKSFDASRAASWGEDEGTAKDFVALNGGHGKTGVILVVPGVPASHILTAHDTSNVFARVEREEGFENESENIAAVGNLPIAHVYVGRDEIDQEDADTWEEFLEDLRNGDLDDDVVLELKSPAPVAKAGAAKVLKLPNRLGVWHKESFFETCDRDDAGRCKPGRGGGKKPSAEPEHGADDTRTEPRSEDNPKRSAPGSQMKPEHREQLRALGMVGTFPPADVPLSAIKMADLSKGKESLKYEALMSWDQKTKSGRVSRQYRYTQEFHDRNAADKFERVTAIEPHLEAIGKGLVQRMRDVSLPQRDREAAAIANAIRETGLRPTDGADSVKHGHFGISSLQARHVTIKGNEVHLDFIGKEGVRNQTVLREPANVAFFKEAMRGKKGEDFVFAKATSDDAGDVLKELSVASGGPADIKVKDLRTVKATQTARKVVQDFSGPPPPLSGNAKKDTKAIASAVLKMSGEVAKVLNNTPTQARDNYIHPRVWLEWQKRLSHGGPNE